MDIFCCRVEDALENRNDYVDYDVVLYAAEGREVDVGVLQGNCDALLFGSFSAEASYAVNGSRVVYSVRSKRKFRVRITDALMKANTGRC